jgi:hypothetical protein
MVECCVLLLSDTTCATLINREERKTFDFHITSVDKKHDVIQTMEVQQVGLFGGAIAMALPTRFSDVSDVRVIGDNEECWVDNDTDQSIMVEIVGYMEEWSTPAEAANGYWADLMQSNEAVNPILRMSNIMTDARLCPMLVQAPGCSVIMMEGDMQAAKYKEKHYNTVQVSMILVRLPHVSTDITITFYRPIAIDPQSASAASINPQAFAEHVSSPASHDEQDKITLLLMQSFRILDWNLFGDS